MTSTRPAGATYRLAFFFLAVLLALPLLSHAQFGGGMGGPMGGGGMGGMRPGGGRGEGRPPPLDGTHREDTGLAVLRGLNETREQLQLKPAQRDAWARYADRVMALAADLQRQPNPARFEGRPAPGQLDALADTARNRLAAVEDVVEAGKALYDALSDEQRALADSRLARIALPLLETDTAAARRTTEGGPIAIRKGSP